MGTRFKSRSVPMTLYLWRVFHYNCAVFSVEPCSFPTAISGKIQETFWVVFFPAAVMVSLRYQGRAAGLETLHYTQREKLDREDFRQLLRFGAAIL